MKEEMLFAAALSLPHPWKVDKVDLSDNEEAGTKELHIWIGYQERSKFLYEGQSCSVYDHQDRSWRHLNFFQHVCYLHCRVPRIKTPEGHVRLVEVPWAGEGSSFTLLFEAYAMLMVKSGMSLAAVGRYLDMDGRVIGRIINRHVSEALVEQPLESTEHIGVDETSIAKGHNYITVLTDLDRKRVIGLGIGKDGAALESAVEEMFIRGASPDEVEVVTQDLSPAYIAASCRCFPNAEIIYDKFHITALLNKAVDEIRKEDARSNVILKKSKYLWLYNNSRLSANQRERVAMLSEACPNIGNAYRLKEQYKIIWDKDDQEHAIDNLLAWMHLARRSGLKQMEKFVETLESHWDGIISYFNKRLTSGFVERVNLKIQEIKRLARGYSSIENFKMMIYFHLGGLCLGLPTKDGR
jgi:transposase